MKILLVRHCKAEAGGIDSERDLTPEGKKDAEIIAKFLSRLGCKPAKIVSSPLKRAILTAQAISKSTNAEVVIDDSLAEATVSTIVSVLQRHLPYEMIIVVGHQPSLGKFVSFACTAGSMEFELKIPPGGICTIETASIPLTSPAKLLWCVNPDLINVLI